MPDMIISEIARKLAYDYLSDEERRLNQHMLARKLNQLLIQTGDLTVCALGKVETDQGSRHGICGELVCPEGKPRYWLPKYSPAGYNYVRKLFLSNKASIIISPNAPEPIYRYTKAAWKALQPSYPSTHVFLLEGNDRYWIYDEDAERVAKALHLSVNHTETGCNIVYRKQTHEKFCKALFARGISYVVVNPDGEDRVDAAPVVIPDLPSIQIGIRFRMIDEDGIEGNHVILDPEESTVLISVHLADGNIQVISVPITELEDCDVISTNAPLAEALMGAKAGEKRSCNGFQYKIIEIFP